MNMKKHICSLLSAVLIISSTTAAYATTSTDSESPVTNEVVSSEMESFINYISVFFENDTQFVAIDFDGNDISNEFYSSCYSLYTSKEFASLKVIADCQIAYLLEKGTQSFTNSPERSLMSVRITQSVSNNRLFYTQPPLPFQSQEYGTTLSSSFVSDPFGNYIFSAASPALTVYDDGGGVYPHEMRNVIIYAPIISSGNVTFSARFSLYKVVNMSEYYAGTFTHTDTYDSAGNLV